MTRLVLVEGLPGSGKTTTAGLIRAGAASRGLAVRYVEEGDPGHPADFEQVAILEDSDVARLGVDAPEHVATLRAAAERHDGYWLIRNRDRASWPLDLRRWLAERDAYDGSVAPDLHTKAMTENWDRFAGAAHPVDLFVFEAVLLQNPVCALVARFDRPESAVAAHVGRLAASVAGLDPVLVYLDPGDPAPVLAAAAAERPAEWLDLVVRYHTEQGYGAVRGLRGFAGYVEFMRMRRELELRLIRELPITSYVLDVSTRDREAHAREVEAVLDRHVGRRTEVGAPVGDAPVAR